MNALGRARRIASPLLLLVITLLGGGLRFFAIGQKGIWLDEAFSVWLGWQRLPEMWGWIARIDQHPPLYYTLLNLWMRLGDSAATVRLLSAVLGTLTIPVIFLLGRRLAGPRVGLLAALVLAVSPFHVRFAQEARMYAMLALLAAAAMTCLAYLLFDRRDSSLSRLRRGQLGAESLSPSWTTVRGMTTGRAILAGGLPWAGYVVFTAAAMLTHSAALLLPLATNLFVFGLMWRQAKTSSASGLQDRTNLAPPPLGSWLLAQAGVLLLWSVIWLPPFIGQATGVYRDFWMPAPTWRTLVDMLGNFLSAHLPRQQMPWTDAIWLVYAALIALGIATLRRRPAVPALLLTLFLTPVIGDLLLSLSRPVFYDRTLIWATIPLYVLLAIGIAELRRWAYIVPVVSLLIAANGVSLREYYVNFQKEGWREAAAFVRQQARAGDLILFNASWTQIPFDFYYRNASTPVAEHGLPADLFERGILEPKMAPEDLPRLQELIQGRERVWLVYGHNWYTDPQGLIPKALSQAHTPSESRSYEGLQIRLYEGIGEH
jgi:mannosyltransferase